MSAGVDLKGSKHISKRGNRYGRYLLIEAAHRVIRTPGPLRAFYERLAARTDKKIAIVATARKVLVTLWHMLTKGESYRWAPPLRTREKWRKVELLAGMPRRKSGPKKDASSAGGRAAYEQQRREDHDPAKAAEAEYRARFRRGRLRVSVAS